MAPISKIVGYYFWKPGPDAYHPEHLRGFPQALQDNAGIVCSNRIYSFLSRRFQTSYHWRYTVWKNENVAKERKNKTK
jgi:hypothetical protein